MKQFQLVVKIDKKVIYKSIINLSEDVEKQYLQIIANVEGFDLFSSELQAVVVSAVGKRKWSKEKQMWDTMTRKKCAVEHPDYAICAHIMTCLYYVYHSNEMDHCFDLPQEVGKEVLINKVPSYPDWLCKRIK